MSSEEYLACALREEGTALCWGSKLDGHQASLGEGYKFNVRQQRPLSRVRSARRWRGPVLAMAINEGVGVTLVGP